MPVENLFFFLAVFCVTSFALLEDTSISIPAFSMVKFPLLYIGGICLLPQLGLFLKNFRKRRYFFVLLSVFLLCLTVLFSAIANRNPSIGVNPIRPTIRFILFLVELFLLSIWICESGRAEYIINFLFWYVLILVILTDVLFFTRAVTFYSGRHENYLVGTKFIVCYMHMDLLILWFVRSNLKSRWEARHKRRLLWSIPLILAVSIRVDCITGIIGGIVLFVFLMMLNTTIQRQFFRFARPSLLFLFLTASVVFPFVVESIVSIPAVTYLIENVFGRDSSLTGRLGIFAVFADGMQGHWLWGYGLGNGNAAAEWLFRCANAQNAILQWVLQSGILVAFMVVLLMLQIFGQLRGSGREKQIMPMIILMYVYVVLGTVETTFNMSVFLWLALIFIYINTKEWKVLISEK